jgi:hypothetical protein
MLRPGCDRYFTAGADPVTAGWGRRGRTPGKQEAQRSGAEEDHHQDHPTGGAAMPAAPCLPPRWLRRAGQRFRLTGLRFSSAGLHVIPPRRPFLRAARRFPGAGRCLARAERPIRPLSCRDRQSRDHLAAGWRGGDRPGLRRDVRLCRVLFCDPACPGWGDGRERRRWHFLRPQARHAGRQHRMRYRRGRLSHGVRARHPPGQRCWPRNGIWVVLGWPLGLGGAAVR